MSAFWISAVSGIVSGISTALLWAAALYGYSKYSDWRIETAMEQQFYPKSFSHNLDGWGMIIDNNTGTEVTVREFSLVGVPLNGRGTSSIGFGLASSFSKKAVKCTDDGWVIMPPFTTATFNVPSPTVIQQSGLLGKLQGARIVIEFRTLIGTHKLFTIMPRFDSEKQQSMARNFSQIFTQTESAQQR